MFRVGLTGGIASGKTTVANMFAQLGAGLVDTDVVAREVVAPGEPGLTAVSRAFGASVLDSSGTLNRAALRTMVFGDPRQRERLEEILPPLIRARTLAQIEALEAPYALIVVPLLVETGFAQLVHRVLVVDCPEATQVQRLMERDRLSEEDARAMMSAQVDRATRLRTADDILDNGGSAERALKQVAQLHSKYHALARVCREQEGRAE